MGAIIIGKKNECTYQKDFSTKIAYNNSNFQKIIDFYLFHCPTDGKSRRGVSFKTKGWIGSGRFGTLKSHMLKNAIKNKDQIK